MWIGRFIALTLLVLMVGYSFPAVSQPPHLFRDSASISFNLSDYQWQNRLLLIFAPTPETPAYQEQLDRLQGSEPGLRDRDLLIFTVLGAGTSHLGNPNISPQASSNLRSRFDVPQDEFTVILIGKDGTEKRRDLTLVSVESIFSEIDAMPMRQREMRSSPSQ